VSAVQNAPFYAVFGGRARNSWEFSYRLLYGSAVSGWNGGPVAGSAVAGTRHFLALDEESSARGRIVAPTGPLNCSRGATRCIPGTFAAYHQEGTAHTPYDVVACMCATVNYVRDRYGVSHDGSETSPPVCSRPAPAGRRAATEP
jgi:hypothetical protein